LLLKHIKLFYRHAFLREVAYANVARLKVTGRSLLKKLQEKISVVCLCIEPPDIEAVSNGIMLIPNFVKNQSVFFLQLKWWLHTQTHAGCSF
jgi:hypothetical protein